MDFLELDHTTVSQGLTPWLVIAVAGRIGSGTSFVRDQIDLELRKYGYDVVPIDVSRVVLERAYSRIFPEESELPKGSYERAAELQKRGTRLRETYSADVVARLFVSTVIAHHECLGEALRARRAYVIDSLKHPAEAKYLRSIFGSAFYLVGVVASDGMRRQRLRERKGIEGDRFSELSRKDAKEESTPVGQRTVATVVQADYFLVNNYHTIEGIERETTRCLRLVFGSRIETPRLDEKGMNAAFKASLGSACLSRQVGAAILDRWGTIIATGCNDVPRFGGGLYSSDDALDKRCWSFGAKCYNDEEKSRIVDELCGILGDLLKRGGIDPPTEEDAGRWLEDSAAIVARFRQELPRSSIRDLIEFSRAVHAEMDALVSLARKGGGDLVGSTLFCTTYPCHNCAKHLVASGIERVVYLEPYEKSLARKLHPDSISDPMAEESEKGKMRLELYGGASPRVFDLFFEIGEERKLAGRYVDRVRFLSSLLPRGAQDLDELELRLQRSVQALGDNSVQAEAAS